MNAVFIGWATPGLVIISDASRLKSKKSLWEIFSAIILLLLFMLLRLILVKQEDKQEQQSKQEDEVSYVGPAKVRCIRFVCTEPDFFSTGRL